MTFQKVYKDYRKLTSKEVGPRCNTFNINCSVCQAYLSLDIMYEQVMVERVYRRQLVTNKKGPKLH